MNSQSETGITEFLSLPEDADNKAMQRNYIPWESDFRLLGAEDGAVATSGTPLRKPGTTNLVQIIRRVGSWNP